MKLKCFLFSSMGKDPCRLTSTVPRIISDILSRIFDLLSKALHNLVHSYIYAHCGSGVLIRSLFVFQTTKVSKRHHHHHPILSPRAFRPDSRKVAS